MDFVTSLIALVIVSAIIVTPSVVLGNYIYHRIKNKTS